VGKGLKAWSNKVVAEISRQSVAVSQKKYSGTGPTCFFVPEKYGLVAAQPIAH